VLERNLTGEKEEDELMSTSPSAAATASSIFKIPRVHIVDTSMASGASSGVSMTIQADADFEWWFLALFRTSGLLKVLIAEAGTANRQLIYSGNPQAQNFQGIFVDNLAGLVANNGAFPIAVPYVMPAGRIYTHQFVDQTSGATNTVQVAYHGYALLSTPS
jgi:hypothetical protein